MIFKTSIIFRGWQPVSSIEKDRRSNRINIEMDRFKNRSVFSFDKIAFNSFVEALVEYKEKGEVSHRPSESCEVQTALESILLDLIRERNFSINFDLGDLRRDVCFFKIKADHAGIFIGFNRDQLNKIIFKFQEAAQAFSNLKEAEKETIIRP